MGFGPSSFGGAGRALNDAVTALQSRLDSILANQPPSSEATAPKAGTVDRASRMDHVHPRLTSATEVVLTASGEATAIFTREFDTKPNAILEYEEEANGQPVALKVKSWLKADGSAWTTGAKYGGCIVRGTRPTTTAAVTVVGISVLGGLTNAAAAGVTVFVTMLAKSSAST